MFPHGGIVPEHFRAALVRTSNSARNLLAAIPLRLDPETTRNMIMTLMALKYITNVRVDHDQHFLFMNQVKQYYVLSWSPFLLTLQTLLVV